MQGLGRRVPKDWKHVERFRLSDVAPGQRPTEVPVVLGCNWYEAFDVPEKDSGGHWWVARTGGLGKVRGGHCVCLQPEGLTDSRAWQVFYDQGGTGACVGYGSSRAMTLLNRKRYEARWLWDQARLGDEFTDNNDLTDPDQGTTVRAGLEVLRSKGHVRFVVSRPVDAPFRDRGKWTSTSADGISAYRWATTASEAMAVLGVPGSGYVTILNSWGASYPRKVRLPAEVLDRLIGEDGECALVTDR